jgi:hypothetical protein
MQHDKVLAVTVWAGTGSENSEQKAKLVAF